jgi:predicted O-methyltransferase YrrM
MSHFDRVTETYASLDYMNEAQAQLIRNFIVERDARDILEIGFYHGKSSAYIAAILEDLGRGHLVTMDREAARDFDPNIETVLSTLGLAHRVTPVYAHRSYTWDMATMIESSPRPQFDLCYFDGDHTWDGTGYGFLLADMLLKPGGWIVFDDLKWTVDAVFKAGMKAAKAWTLCSPDEQQAPAVQMVFDLLVPHLGYTDLEVAHKGWWGIARKPFDGPRKASEQFRPGLWRRISNVLRRR